MKSLRLTKEEKEIEKDIASGKYRSVKNLKQEIKRFQQYARNTIAKTETINIRLTKPDLHRVKVKAAEKGLPYQTFIGSLIHQYNIGKIREVVRDE